VDNLIYYWYVRGFSLLSCEFRGVRGVRTARNGPVENAAVDIVENLDFDSSSDNEIILEEAPHGRARPQEVIAPSDPELWLDIDVKPPYKSDLQIESMKKFILE